MRGCTQRVVLADTIDHGGFGDAGTTNTILALQQGYLVPGALQVIGGDQAIDSGTDDADVVDVFRHGLNNCVPQNPCGNYHVLKLSARSKSFRRYQPTLRYPKSFWVLLPRLT